MNHTLGEPARASYTGIYLGRSRPDYVTFRAVRWEVGGPASRNLLSGDAAITEPATQTQTATARSQIYHLFAEAIEYPADDASQKVRDGDWARALEELFSIAAPGLGEDLTLAALRDAGDDDEALAIEYTRLFDVGASGPPCPLFGGLYDGARMKTMEEVIRFYEHFGLKTSQARRELPDHLATELEFLHFLSFSEAEALAAGADPEPFRRAQRDFLARHPAKWVPELLQRIEQHQSMGYFYELILQLNRFLEHELASLGGVSAPGDSAQVADSAIIASQPAGQ